ncbi:hypothetical protein [Sediminibacterium goheungense]|uniref:Uncharacterized protein n=1 Tax=Sediminibacterium goheungense TaxID=1086393 RepID=A0A4R6J213_9BACT|nr:hypothetical protein [Sediminibacterium goheungense]TDO29253.1 hypothetical protein BC659_1339 [Sediminibacterium goheungense]
MILAIKKLIEHVDQLVVWLKENQGVPIPTPEKKRLVTILNKIIEAEEITNEEWEQLKPKIEPTSHLYNTNIWTSIKRVISSPKKASIRKEPYQKPIISSKLDTKRKSQSSNQINQNDREMTICNDCESPVLKKNLKRHKKRCKPPKHKYKRDEIKKTKDSERVYIKSNNEKNNEKLLDGSYGFHQFRENGRFGSYPSFDNMGDESNP